MQVLKLSFVLGLLAATSSTLTHAIQIQSPNVKGDQDKANAVRDSFKKSYAAYKKYCYGHDELEAHSLKCDDSFLGGWGASLVDAMSTAQVMGLTDVFDDGVKKIGETDYTKTSLDKISFFETTIRHLGGLLSAYDLNGRKDKVLLDQASTLATRLARAWVGDNPAPFNSLLDWNQGPHPNTSTDAIVAETGTNILEFDRLSKFTGNKTYLELATKSMKATINMKPLPFDHLNSMGINPRNGKPKGTDLVTWGGGTDSFFEYEIKYA